MNSNFSNSCTIFNSVNQYVDITPSGIGHKIKNVAKNLALGIGLIVVTANISRIITYSGFCFKEYIPPIGWDIGKKTSDLYSILYDQIPGGCPVRKFTGGNQFDHIIKGPICEELFDRLFIQEILLKQLPKKILQKYSPQNVSFVDFRVAQIARVLISSTLFTLSHVSYQQKKCDAMNLTFVAGLVLGTLQEKTGSIFASTALHIMFNCVSSALK